jgi:hypothetical protein
MFYAPRQAMSDWCRKRSTFGTAADIVGMKAAGMDRGGTFAATVRGCGGYGGAEPLAGMVGAMLVTTWRITRVITSRTMRVTRPLTTLRITAAQ